MNKILIRYLFNNYIKIFLKVFFIFYCFGVILNLFEEIEFFKNLEVNFTTPIFLTVLHIPSMIIQLLPFIIFITSMKFIIDIKNNKDLLTIKVFGISNLKVFLLISFISFFIGWFSLFFLNPITSSMSKYYEKIKANYSKDIDHLVTFNKNGLWIKENLENGQRIISAKEIDQKNLKKLTIFNFDKNYNLVNKIYSNSANIEKNKWVLKDVILVKFLEDVIDQSEFDELEIDSIYTYEKITSLYKNFDTLSFINLITNYKSLLDQGYSNIFLKQSFNNMLSMPFFLITMTALASILVMGKLTKSNNMRYIVIGLISCITIYYLKDLSIALGKTNRIPLTLATWMPIIITGLFSSVGVLQINEK
jgi:lipopolysaccharide export system permease protein